MPAADLTRPSSPSPASVTPRCKGYDNPSFCIIPASIRVACIITEVSEDFIERTRSLKFSDLKIFINSMAENTIPFGVFPNRVIIRSDREP